MQRRAGPPVEEAIAGKKSDSYLYKTQTYVRRRIEKFERVGELLAEHDPDLLGDLR